MHLIGAFWYGDCVTKWTDCVLDSDWMPLSFNTPSLNHETISCFWKMDDHTVFS